MVLAAAAQKPKAQEMQYRRDIGSLASGPGQLFPGHRCGMKLAIFLSVMVAVLADGAFNPNLGNRVDVFSLRVSMVSQAVVDRGIWAGLDRPADLNSTYNWRDG